MSSRDQGKRLLSIYLSHFPGTPPERYGDVEPLKHEFEPEDIDSAVQCWGGRFYYARRRVPDLSIHVLGSKGQPMHSSIAIDLELKDETELVKFESLVKDLSDAFAVDHAMAHILTNAELEDRLREVAQRVRSVQEGPAEAVVERLRQRTNREGPASVLRSMMIEGLAAPRLKKCLPGLYWINVFGAPYVELFGEARIMQTPGVRTEKLKSGGVALELAESLADDTNAWKSFKAVRDACQVHLGVDAFCDPAAQIGHVYQSPRFRFLTSSAAH